MGYVISAHLLSGIIADWLRNTPDACGSGSDSLAQPQRFYLRHPDLSVNNIFVDDQYQVTCLIDWGFCSTVPLPVLLAAPGLPQTRNRLEESLVSAFERGVRIAAFDVIQDSPQGYHNLCAVLQYSRPAWLVSRLLDFDSIEDYTVFHDLWKLIGPEGKSISDEFRTRRASPYYRKLYEEMEEEGPSADQVSRYQNSCFPDKPKLRISIAKKLSLVSDWT